VEAVFDEQLICINHFLFTDGLNCHMKSLSNL